MSAYVFDEGDFAIIKNEYRFLGFHDADWNYFYKKALKEAKKDFDGVPIKNCLENLIHCYIHNEIQRKQTSIMDNLLLLLKKEYVNNKQLLKFFWRKLEICDIHLSDEYLEVLKKQSVLWKQVLDCLGISDFNRLEIIHYIHGKYDYIIKINGNTLNESIQKMRYFANLFGYSMDFFKQEYEKGNSKEYLKFALLLQQTLAFDSLYSFILEDIPYLKKDDFYQVLFSLSYLNLKTYVDSIKKTTIKKSDVWVQDLIHLIVRKVRFDSSKEERKTSLQENKSQDNRKKRSFHTIYDICSPDIFGITLEKYHFIMDQLFSKLSIDEQNIVMNYINYAYGSRTTQGIKALRIIRRLQSQYQSYYNFRKKNITSIYEISDPEEFHIPVEEYSSFVDALFQALPIAKQEIVNHFVHKDYEDNPDMKVEAKEIIRYLRIQLDRFDQIKNEDCPVESVMPHTRFILELIHVIQDSCHVSLENHLSVQMQRSFFHAFELIGQHYPSNGGNIKEYRAYFYELFIQVFTMNPHFRLEELLKQTIYIASQEYLNTKTSSNSLQ